MKEDKCIVLGCRNKKAEGMNFCKNCYTYLKTGSKNNSKACKNDILNITYMDNLTEIDNELDRINEINKGQITMDYNNDKEKDD